MKTPERNRNRIIRLYKIERLLIIENGMTAQELCTLLLVNRRTIYRDFQLMQELGIPLYKDGRKLKILDAYKIPSYRPKIIPEN